jgi:hypothetical protein
VSSSACEEEEVAKNNVELIQGDEGKKGRTPMSMTIGPEVQIEAGVVRCIPRNDRGVLAFKGIPFADPPVGDLRWHAPQPPQAWSGVRDATQGFGLASV